MVLHPDEIVQSFLETHQQALGEVTRALDDAIQIAFAFWEEHYQRVEDVSGDAFCSVTRGLLWSPSSRADFEERSLIVADRPPNSKQLMVRGGGRSVRVRRHPWNRAKCRRVEVSSSPTWTLFGDDNSSELFELALLWSPDYTRKALGTAYLAAVSGLDSDKPEIYERKGIEPAGPVVAASRKANSEVDQLARFLEGRHQADGNGPTLA